jgi:hypothetical protein
MLLVTAPVVIHDVTVVVSIWPPCMLLLATQLLQASLLFAGVPTVAEVLLLLSLLLLLVFLLLWVVVLLL